MTDLPVLSDFYIIATAIISNHIVTIVDVNLPSNITNEYFQATTDRRTVFTNTTVMHFGNLNAKKIPFKNTFYRGIIHIHLYKVKWEKQTSL